MASCNSLVGNDEAKCRSVQKFGTLVVAVGSESRSLVVGKKILKIFEIENEKPLKKTFKKIFFSKFLQNF